MGVDFEIGHPGTGGRGRPVVDFCCPALEVGDCGGGENVAEDEIAVGFEEGDLVGSDGWSHGFGCRACDAAPPLAQLNSSFAGCYETASLHFDLIDFSCVRRLL